MYLLWCFQRQGFQYCLWGTWSYFLSLHRRMPYALMIGWAFVFFPSHFSPCRIKSWSLSMIARPEPPHTSSLSLDPTLHLPLGSLPMSIYFCVRCNPKHINISSENSSRTSSRFNDRFSSHTGALQASTEAGFPYTSFLLCAAYPSARFLWAAYVYWQIQISRHHLCSRQRFRMVRYRWTSKEYARKRGDDRFGQMLDDVCLVLLDYRWWWSSRSWCPMQNEAGFSFPLLILPFHPRRLLLIDKRPSFTPAASGITQLPTSHTPYSSPDVLYCDS